MAEEKERATPKSRIETLSDLIFGLALSIGALTLIGQPPSNIGQLLVSLLDYGFSFLILIRVWYSYTQTMADLRVETRRSVFTNIGLLFLVSIEPFLFNQLITSKISDYAQYVSIIYAFDLGGLFAILAVLASSILAQKNLTEHRIKHYALLRNTLVISSAFFFISALPFFWTLTIPINGDHVQLRFLLWIIPLVLIPIRRQFEKTSSGKHLSP